MSGLQAGVSLTRVRAAVTVVSPDATVNYVLPVASLKHIHIVLGAELDSIGFNKFFYEIVAVVDQSRLSVGKGANDAVGIVDETTYVLFKKGALEQLQTVETRSFDVDKQLSDVVDATDDFMGLANLDDEQVVVFGKALPVEQQHVADTANVTTGKHAIDAVGSLDVQELAVSKGLSELLVSSETLSADFEKTLADLVDAGDEFNAVASSDDGEIKVFGKRVYDEFTQSDAVSVQAEKGFEEQQTTADQVDYIEVGKGVEDTPQTTESMLFDTSKGIEDTPQAQELMSFGLGISYVDQVLYGDGPNQYNTYAISYFGEDYALEGFPALSFNKGLFDTVYTTDDFFGAANTDDDETMQFGKVIVEMALSTDSIQFSYSKALTDLFSKSDSTAIGLGKSLADTFSKTDFAVKGTNKAINDFGMTLEIVVRGIGKGINDPVSTAEYNSFAIQKRITDTVHTTDDFLGNANADDDETMLLGKTISDSFTKSDLTVKSAGKGLADTAGTSESGSIVWTDYWPIGYTDTTSGVYVGNSRTF
jgi:hypothetical protein